MDTRDGRIYRGDDEALSKLLEERPQDLRQFEYGQKVELKDGGWFEVVKISVEKQRIVLKPIPRPAIDEMIDPLAASRRKIEGALDGPKTEEEVK